LPIVRMTDEKFGEVRSSILDNSRLTTNQLYELKKIYGLDPNSPIAVRVSCNEAHLHGYACLEFCNRHSAVVCRLIEEVERLGDYLEKQAEKAKVVLGR